MSINARGVALIQSFEGCRLKAYKCAAGVWTIGWGHTAGVTAGMTCTQKQADDWLKSDIEKFCKIVDKEMASYHLNENQYAALVSFTYNCGAANLVNLTKSGRRSLAQIADAMLLYNKARGIVLAGLTKRRKAERELFLSPVMVEYYPAYEGESPRIDEVMHAIGADADYNKDATSSWEKRVPIAKVNGIKSYTGTAAQNNKLIKLAKAGKLRRC